MVLCCVHSDEMPNLYLQTMTCVLAPPVSNSVLTILVEWCAPVTPDTDTTVSATETERSPTVWVRPCTKVQQDNSSLKTALHYIFIKPFYLTLILQDRKSNVFSQSLECLGLVKTELSKKDFWSQLEQTAADIKLNRLISFACFEILIESPILVQCTRMLQ